jgi:hypothetical protein
MTPIKTPSTYMTRSQVKALCLREGLTVYKFRLLFGAESPARKCLPSCKRPVYVRAAVMELLGLT